MSDPEAIRRYPIDFALAQPDAGEPVDRVLRRKLRADPAHVQKLLRQRRVTLVAPAPADAPGVADALAVEKMPGDRVLARGDVLPGVGILRIGAAPARVAPQPNRRIRLSALAQGEHWVVLDKPAGLPMHPGPRHGSDTLLNALVAAWPECLLLGAERGYGLVHRLDRETSGVLIIARTALGYDQLVQAFQERRVEKRYIALVDERKARLADAEVDSAVAGKDAITRFRVLGRAPRVALVEALPLTGRTHQIRIHLAGAGTPVLADARYGSGLDDLTAALYMKRLALHAERIAFPDPASGERVEITRDWPRDLRHAWRRASRAAE